MSGPYKEKDAAKDTESTEHDAREDAQRAGELSERVESKAEEQKDN